MAFRSNQTYSSCFPSSSSAPSYNHDVFLSFRGKDTRKNFTGHLHTALTQAGIRSFIDEAELQRGKDIPPELRQAIRESRISIIVFSKNYASSRWCLDELLEILECMRTMGRLVLPVFFDVDTSDVRYQIGSCKKAFERHEERFVDEMDKVEKWRAALTEAANLSGFDLENDANGHESRFIQKIVMNVLLEVDPRYMNLPKNPVGIDSRVNDINPLLSIGSNDVRLIGIYGMGGIGKTTIAKAVFNKKFHYFEGSYFAENVREVSERHPNGLVNVQEKLLSALLKRNVKVDHVDKGICLMKERCWSRRVLIVLDDLDKPRQLKALAGRHWFGAGSRIIFTTRNVHLLDYAQVDKRYEVMDLDDKESLELLSWHAFSKPIPSKEYVLLTKGIVHYARGLPLALEAIGCSLVGKTTVEWKSALEKLHQIPNDEIQKQLRISFDALGDDKVKGIFLDLACFFNGMEKDYPIKFWNACGFFAENGISNLVNKCLLKIDDGNYLRMHNHLRDMGREIIREESPRRPGNRNRLWLHEDVCDVLKKNKGTEVIECIVLNLFKLEKMHLNTKTFERMHILRLLQIDNVHLTGSFENIFEELKWLRWHYCPLECLPLDFHPEKLVILEMRFSKINTLWLGIKFLKNLMILDLSYCKDLTKTPDFTGVPRLERLSLAGCSSLFEVHRSIGSLGNLVYLNLRDCTNLESLPSSICDLRSLEELYLHHCSNLEQLPKQLGNMECLVYLNLDYCEKLIDLPTSICDLRSLEELNISGCSNMKRLPEQIGNLECLRILSAKGTPFKEIPDSIGLLKNLKDLCLELYPHPVTFSERFPPSIFRLYSLRKLLLENCGRFIVPADIGISLSSLKDFLLLGSLYPYGNNFCSLSQLSNLLSNLNHLFELNLKNCSRLVQVQGLENLNSAQYVDMSGCSNLEMTFKENFFQRYFGHGRDIFPPRREIPDWFSHQGMGSSISFDMPLNLENNFFRIALWVVYVTSKKDTVGCNYSAYIINQTNADQSHHGILSNSYTSGEVSWVSIKQTFLSSGDRIQIFIEEENGMQVERCGFHLLCELNITESDSDDDFNTT